MRYNVSYLSLYLQYEERIWQMADGYSQIHHNSSSFDFDIWRGRTKMDNLSRWDISRSLHFGLGSVSCQRQQERRIVWEH